MTRRLSTLLVLVAAISLATTAHATPILSATHSVTPNGNIAWEIMFEGGDGVASSSAFDLKFTGDFVQVLAFGFLDVNDLSNANNFDTNDPSYSKAEDSWFYSGSGTPWTITVPSTFPGNNGGAGGIDGMGPGETEAYFSAGSGTTTPVENALVAHLVIDSSASPTGQFLIEGILARGGQDFAVNEVFAVPEPSTLVLAAMGGCVGLVTVVRRRRR